MNSIAREDMRAKVDKALELAGGLYTFDDLMRLISEGKMQSFAHGDTWVITQVNDYPQKRELQISFVIGFMDEAIKALPGIYEYARSIDANRVTALGRDGWWQFRQSGWHKVGSLYAKDM